MGVCWIVRFKFRALFSNTGKFLALLPQDHVYHPGQNKPASGLFLLFIKLKLNLPLLHPMTVPAQYFTLFEEYINTHRFTGSPATLYDPANYIMSLGGKRLRPLMVLLAAEAAGGDVHAALPAAMAIEVFHNFTLVHDDIMDAAPLRRSKPTVHTKWDTPTAILSGDMMMFRSVMFLQQLPPEIFQKVLPVFTTTAIEVCEGQQLDMDFERRDDVTIDEYLHMIALKTSVLLGCSFHIGAVCGGGSERLASDLYSFGKNLGIAFQLHDDILDAFATDASNFGKQVGGDILANKKTFLWLKAMELGDENQKASLNQWLTNNTAGPAEKVEAVKKIFIESGAQRRAEEEMQHYYTRALDALQQSELADEKKQQLTAFAEMIMKRTK